MGWIASDTRRLKDEISEFSSVDKYQTNPKTLAKTIEDKGTACLLGEANCEYFLKDCVFESSKKNPKVFVLFTIRDGHYLNALVEAGMLRRNEKGNVAFTKPGIAWLCDWYRLPCK